MSAVNSSSVTPKLGATQPDARQGAQGTTPETRLLFEPPPVDSLPQHASEPKPLSSPDDSRLVRTPAPRTQSSGAGAFAHGVERVRNYFSHAEQQRRAADAASQRQNELETALGSESSKRKLRSLCNAAIKAHTKLAALEPDRAKEINAAAAQLRRRTLEVLASRARTALATASKQGEPSSRRVTKTISAIYELSADPDVSYDEESQLLRECLGLHASHYTSRRNRDMKQVALRAWHVDFKLATDISVGVTLRTDATERGDGYGGIVDGSVTYNEITRRGTSRAAAGVDVQAYVRALGYFHLASEFHDQGSSPYRLPEPLTLDCLYGKHEFAALAKLAVRQLQPDQWSKLPEGIRAHITRLIAMQQTREEVEKHLPLPLADLVIHLASVDQWDLPSDHGS